MQMIKSGSEVNSGEIANKLIINTRIKFMYARSAFRKKKNHHRRSKKHPQSSERFCKTQLRLTIPWVRKSLIFKKINPNIKDYVECNYLLRKK